MLTTLLSFSVIPFYEQDFLATATRWTKNRIFASGGGVGPPSGINQYLGGPTSPSPLSTSPIALAGTDPAHYYAKPTIELSSSDGTFLIAYPSVAQLWEFSINVPTGGAYCITGSTFAVNGKIISAHFINYSTNSSQSPSTEYVNEAEGYDDNSVFDTDPHSLGPHETESCATSHSTKHQSPNYVLLQVVRRENIHLEVHQLNKKPSFVQALVLPPSSSGPGPYTIYSRYVEKCIAIITKTGAITLFSVPDFHIMPLSDLQTSINSDGVPLFDMCGRWLVFSPTLPAGPATKNTPVKLPDPGLLLDRILENISSTTAASLKSLSDAGVAGIRNYLGKDSSQQYTVTKSAKQPKRTGNNVIYVGSNKFNVDSSGRIGPVGTGSSGSTVSSLPAALSSLFYTQTKPQPIQIIDIETQTTVCTFISPQGLSFLSLSPHDTVLATVSARGDCVYTFDLSFVPRQVSLSGKYVRGKTPAKVSHIEWDSEGGFGIITRDKGSVHWFERQPWNTYENQVGGVSIDGSSTVLSNFSKLWRLSGWNISSMCMIPEYIGNEDEVKNRYSDIPLISPEPSPFTKKSSASSSVSFGSSPVSFLSNIEKRVLRTPKFSKIAMLRDGEIFVVDLSTGSCSWKYDLPSLPVTETLLQPVLFLTENTVKLPVTPPISQYRVLDHYVEPLSFYEMETCLPYPFVHTDRHVILATYADEDSDINDDNDVYDYESEVQNMFGLPINATELDFGLARGLANFSGDSVTPPEADMESTGYYGGLLGEDDAEALAVDIPWEKAKELQIAMESMVLNQK